MYMTNKYCDTSLLPGTIIMGKESVSTIERNITVLQDNVIVSNNSIISNYNNLVVKLEPPTSQLVIELSIGATFHDNSGCNNQRTNNNNNVISINEEEVITNNNGIVTIMCGWAKGYSSGVKLTEPFQFYIQSESEL